MNSTPFRNSPPQDPSEGAHARTGFLTGSTPFSEIKKKNVYFIGIGGIGMSALAQWFLSQKWTVFGSDIAESNITQNLEKMGVKVKIGHKKTNLHANISVFIYNQAILPENSELMEATRRKGALVLSYAEALGFLTRYYDTCAVAGSHGKSTTTSLLSLALLKGKIDPTVIVGTLLREFGKRAHPELNFRAGRSSVFVLEADEFHSSFLNYSPLHAIITNIDREHLDWYENFENVKRAFLEFIKNMRHGGVLILNKDDAHLRSLAKKIKQTAEKNKTTVFWYSLKDKNALKIKKAMRHIPGTHMLSNAYAAFLLAKYLGVGEKEILGAFKEYNGVWRRMEYKGKFQMTNSKSQIFVYDDYGHHPTEITATLKGAKEFFKKKNIICVFQPHQGKRLKILFKEFTKAFDDADVLFLFPIYKVAGRDENEKKYNSENLAEMIIKRKKIKNVFYLESFAILTPLVEYLVLEKALPYRDSVLIMMGAGNINKETEKILEKNQ